MADIQISGFELLSKLGQGGMATVWKARQISLDRTVAIKILAPRLAADPGDIQRFQQEAQSAAKLKHPGIVQVYDANIENGLYYFVMEFVAGYTCADWQMRKGHLNEGDVLLVADSVAAALDYAWAREKLIHCDIKPDNIMIDDDGTVKVADLGLARTISAMTSAASDEILGTPAYMAPEQAMGAAGLDCRTDMYSLGAMLYHLATGALPFVGYDAEEVMDRQIQDFMPNPRDLNPSLSRGFCRLIEVLMAKEQAGRPRDWQQVREAIKRIIKRMMPQLHLPEGVASTVLPSKSQGDDGVLHIPAGSSVAAHALRADDKTYKVPLAIVMLFVVCATVAVFVLRFGRGETVGHDASVTVAGEEGEQQVVPLLALQARTDYDDASAWEKRHPTQIDAAMVRYRAVVSEYGDSPYAARAQRDLERLDAAKQALAVEALHASLKSEADRLMAQRDYDAAIRTHAEYTGVYEFETRPARMAYVAEMKRVQAAWLEDERVRIASEKAAKVDALLDAVARACVEGSFHAAARSVEQVLGEELIVGSEDALRSLGGMLQRAARIDAEIIASFVRQQGQYITVDLVSGAKRLLINGARGDVVLADTVIPIPGGTANRVSNFRLADLSVNERIQRMGPDSQPHVSLAKGVMAYALDSFDHAKRFFVSTDALLAPRLAALVEDRQSRFDVDVMITRLRELKSAAGLSPVAEFDQIQWIDVVQAATLSSVQADALRQAAQRFHEENESRPGYDQVAEVVAAMRSVEATLPDRLLAPPVVLHLPNVVLADDIAVLVGNPVAVMDRLLADNRSLGSGNVEMRKDDEGRVIGVRIRSHTIGDIRAIAALRDLRSFEMRAGGWRDTAPLADISALAGLPLDTVIIEGAAVDNLQPLRGLPMRRLHVPRTNVRDLAPLRGIRLESVDFSGTRVFDFGPLSQMPITSFAANNSQLRDLGFMRGWQLESLELSNTGVFDFSVLSGMPLQRLRMANTQIKTLDILRHCPLVELDISGSGVRDLHALRAHAATLRELRIDRLPAQNFDVLRSLQLRVLSMANTRFHDVRLVAHMPLIVFCINDTPVATLEGLDTSRLANLQIEGTRVTSIQPLEHAGALRRLHCRNTGIRNFMPIYDSGITHLFVDNPDGKAGVFRRLPNLISTN